MPTPTEHFAPQELVMTVGEDLVMGIDYTDLLAVGETMTSATTITATLQTGSGSLTLGSPSLSGNQVVFSADGASIVANSIYLLEATAVTSAHPARKAHAFLYVF